MSTLCLEPAVLAYRLRFWELPMQADAHIGEGVAACSELLCCLTSIAASPDTLEAGACLSIVDHSGLHVALLLH